jgi:rare lipoprotein A (peptidoglycan hydrolase)
MVLVPLVSLAAVRDTAPSAEVRLDAAVGSSSGDLASPAIDDRRTEFAAPIRASRSAVRSRTAFEEANQAPTTTTTTTAPPPTTTTSTTRPKPTTTTTAKPKPVPTTTTTARPKPTTTTAPPATTTTTAQAATTTSTMPPVPPCCRQEGGASYHQYADPRTCAHRSLPKGTALRVTNLANGRTTTCVVNDRGPFVEGRILDLSATAFGEIANVSEGVIRVSIEW